MRAERVETGRSGRPASEYRLSESGDHLFPKHYDELTVLLIDAVVEELGADAAKRVLARLTDERVAALEPHLRGMSLRERVEALRDWYLDGDPFMDVEENGDGLRLIERNCPFLKTALRRPALCSVSVNALSRLLGVRVVREERFQNGDGRCVFRIDPREPFTTSEFAFEA